jgi:hypothetical protein
VHLLDPVCAFMGPALNIDFVGGAGTDGPFTHFDTLSCRFLYDHAKA